LTNFCSSCRTDNYTANIEVEGRVYNVSLWDTAGQEEYDRLRPLSYPQTDCFMLCFSIAYPPSLENCRDKWALELDTLGYGTVPRVLVGCKSDLRTDPSPAVQRRLVPADEATQVADECGCLGYYETSALSQQGLREAFIGAIKAAASGIPTQRGMAAAAETQRPRSAKQTRSDEAAAVHHRKRKAAPFCTTS